MMSWGSSSSFTVQFNLADDQYQKDLKYYIVLCLTNLMSIY